MALGLIGTKLGMTRIFTEDGQSTPVTVVEVQPNRVTQLKTVEIDGYSAVQVTTGTKKANRLSKPLAGHFAKAGVGAGNRLAEFRVTADEAKITVTTPAAEEGAEATEESRDVQVGDELKVNLFSEGQVVDVTGTSKGKGFQGVIKRYNFQMQDATHGNSLAHRAPGSIGQNQTPGRVFKGKKMAGQMGNVRVTTQNLKVVRADTDKNVLLIKGAVPGATGGAVIVRPATKA